MRQALIDLEESQIREVANAGLGRSDVLKFWFGEGDEVTPEVVRQAAIDSIASGETFYSHNLGLIELREALSAYTTRLHGHATQAFGVERFAVTTGGVNALMLTMQALLDAGDEVLAVTPVWPNLVGQPLVMGAVVRTHSLVPNGGQWGLDVDTLCADITPRTKALVVNAPNNPTGWCLTRAEQAKILARCRETGTWIVADEVYERLFYPPPSAANLHQCAPSFLDLASTDDRLVVVHSFSKSFLMTGWRLGWLVMPPALADHMGKLIEYNTSCASVFTQRAALAALAHEADITPRVRAHLQLCRDTLIPLLQATPGVQVQAALGGMYAFFKLDGFDDSLGVAKRLVVEAGLGLAPGTAFSPHAQGWLRWCFASTDTSRLVAGVERLRHWLAQNASSQQNTEQESTP